MNQRCRQRPSQHPMHARTLCDLGSFLRTPRQGNDTQLLLLQLPPDHGLRLRTLLQRACARMRQQSCARADPKKHLSPGLLHGLPAPPTLPPASPAPLRTQLRSAWGTSGDFSVICKIGGKKASILQVSGMLKSGAAISIAHDLTDQCISRITNASRKSKSAACVSWNPLHDEVR